MSEPSPELVRAAEWLTAELHSFSADIKAPLRVVLAALPEEVTSPKPKLPTEPGYYADCDGEVWRIMASGQWRFGPSAGLTPEKYAPFTRLVTQRPLVDASTLLAIFQLAGRGPEGWEAVAEYVNAGERP
jgi:hypothetical protein